RLARPLRARGVGHEYRHGAAGARAAGRGGAGHARTGGALAPVELPARRSARYDPGHRAPPHRHRALGGDGHAVRRPGVLAGPDAGHGGHLLRPPAPRLRARGAGRERPRRRPGGVDRSADPPSERGGVKRLLRDRRAVFGAGVLIVVVAAAIAAPLVTHGDRGAQPDIVSTRFLPPLATDARGAIHPLGTDRFGRDVWTRLVYGARISLGVGVLAVLLAIAIGLSVGAVAGYWRGPLRALLLAVTDVALALPRVVLLLLLAAVWLP